MWYSSSTLFFPHRWVTFSNSWQSLTFLGSISHHWTISGTKQSGGGEYEAVPAAAGFGRGSSQQSKQRKLQRSDMLSSWLAPGWETTVICTSVMWWSKVYNKQRWLKWKQFFKGIKICIFKTPRFNSCQNRVWVKISCQKLLTGFLYVSVSFSRSNFCWINGAWETFITLSKE